MFVRSLASRAESGAIEHKMKEEMHAHAFRFHPKDVRRCLWNGTAYFCSTNTSDQVQTVEQ
jgi:hypothetical protein